MYNYLYCINGIVNICSQFDINIKDVYFSSQNILYAYCWTSYYQKRFNIIKSCIKLCELIRFPSLRGYYDDLKEAMISLERPSDIASYENFRSYLNHISSILALAKNEIFIFYTSIDEDEKERVNEAIHALFDECNYSCIAMSVSAVESRLLKLMSGIKPDSINKLTKLTLGQLITEYVENPIAYKNIVPAKHEPLLEMCNTYRVFSVHPKKEKITTAVAQSIFLLAITFLTDKDMQLPEVEKRLKTND